MKIRLGVKTGSYHACMSSAPSVPLHRRLKLRHLELLAALQGEASLHRAARELGMTQPAASKLLLEAESAVGLRLFERSRRGVTPTPAGAALSARARRLLGVLDGARDELAAIEAGATGLVCVGASAAAASVLVPRAVAWLRDHGGPVCVRVEEAGSEVLLDGLRNGTLDCVIGRVLDSDDTAGFSVEALYHPTIVIVARPGHPLLRRRPPRSAWAAAATFAWVLPPPHAPLRRTLASWLAQQNLPMPPCAMESVSILANVTVVRDSDALAMLPRDAAQHYETLGLVKVLQLPFEAPVPPVSLLLRRDEAPGESLKEFCRALRAVRPS